MEFSDVLGWTATILFTICYIPQIVKTYKTNTIEGLSFGLLFISFIANIIAFWYAILIKQSPLQIKYAFAILLLIGCIYTYLRIYLKHSKVKNK